MSSLDTAKNRKPVPLSESSERPQVESCPVSSMPSELWVVRSNPATVCRAVALYVEKKLLPKFDPASVPMLI
jgi:hypothetical protein